MKPAFKIAGYVAFIVGMVTFAMLFYGAYSRQQRPPPGSEPVEGAVSGQIGERRQVSLSELVAHSLGFVACAIGMGLLLARDVSEFLGSKSVEFIFNDEGLGERDADYEACETLVAGGNYMEAVRMLREYLNRHPRRQYAALRIAELYENHLHNPLAAALEYEEILKKPLPPERWGWCAIHLSNLYSGKLDKTEQALALLHRIVNEHGQTAAAKKARERLGLPEPAPAPAPAPAGESAASGLPEGFRPKSDNERAVHAEPVSETLKPAPVEPKLDEGPEEDLPEEAPLPPGFRPKKT